MGDESDWSSWSAKIDEWVEKFLANPKNLATETELREQSRVAISYFRQSDLNKSSTLSFDELKRLCDEMGLPIDGDEEEALRRLDTDGSGELDMEEWAQWWLSRISFLPNPAKQQEAIARNTFDKFDKDKSGFIDAAELRSLITALGADFSDDEIAEAINEIDTDSSGVIESDEFVIWWTNRAQANRNNATSLVTLKLRKLAAKAAQVFHTDIFNACWQGDEALVKSFLESEPRLAKAHDDSEYGESWTPLQYASYQGHASIVERLLQVSDLNVNAANKLGFTALFYAAQRGHIGICQMLMDRGADPTLYGTHGDEDSLFLCPLDHIVDYKELRTIFQQHNKCKPPPELETSQIEVSINLHHYLQLTVSRDNKRPLSTVPIKYFKIKLSVDEMEHAELATEIDEFPVCEMLLPAPNPSKQPQVSTVLIDAKFLKFVKYAAYLSRLNHLELSGNKKKDVFLLWEQARRFYDSIDPVYRNKVALERKFLEALERGSSDSSSLILRQSFKSYLAESGGGGGGDGGGGGNDGGASEGVVTVTMALSVDQLEEVVKNFIGVNEAHAMAKDTGGGGGGSAKTSASNLSKPVSRSASGAAVAAQKQSTSNLDRSAQAKASASSATLASEKKSGSAGALGDSKNMSSAASLASNATNPAAKTRAENTDLITQQLNVQVALVTSLHTGDYSSAIEVSIKI